MPHGQRDMEQPFALGDLLPAPERDRLCRALAALLDAEVRIVDSAGQRLAGPASPIGGARRVPVDWEFEPVGYLETTSADPARQRLALEWLALVMKANARYRLAAELHHTITQSDYQALQESEQRYRVLNEQLEQRVADQVKAIETTQRHLYQSEKLASVGRLAAGMAHEINNPIGFIRSNLNSAHGYLADIDGLKAQMQSDPQAVGRYWQEHELDALLADFHELLQESIAGTDRISRIVSDLKVYSHVDLEERGPCRLDDIVRSACAMLAPQIPPGVEIRTELESVPAIDGEPARLGELCYNLLHNALQAIDQNGTVVVTTSQHDGQVVLEIADTGCGISATVRERIFDPFFTTRQVGAGTGLGLTVANDIAQGHGGTIDVQSREGQGTRVRVALPVAGAANRGKESL